MIHAVSVMKQFPSVISHENQRLRMKLLFLVGNAYKIANAFYFVYFKFLQHLHSSIPNCCLLYPRAWCYCLLPWKLQNTLNFIYLHTSETAVTITTSYPFSETFIWELPISIFYFQ